MIDKQTKLIECVKAWCDRKIKPKKNVIPLNNVCKDGKYIYRDQTGNCNYTVYSYIYLMNNGTYKCYEMHCDYMKETLEKYKNREKQPKMFNNVLELVMYLASSWGDEPTITFDVLGRYWIEFGMCNNEYIAAHEKLLKDKSDDKKIEINGNKFLNLTKCTDEDQDVIDFINKATTI